MSHVIVIAAQLKCPIAVKAAAHRLGLPKPVPGKHRLYSRTAEGWGVQLPGWNYPLVIDLETGQVQFDNFEGRWGSPAELDRFRQAYSVVKTTREARNRGFTVQEHPLPDGSIRLTLQTGGAA